MATGHIDCPVKIICESSEFSVDNVGCKGNRTHCGQLRLVLFLDSHNSMPTNVPSIRRRTNHLERFPLIHSGHHNNKPYEPE